MCTFVENGSHMSSKGTLRPTLKRGGEVGTHVRRRQDLRRAERGQVKQKNPSKRRVFRVPRHRIELWTPQFSVGLTRCLGRPYIYLFSLSKTPHIGIKEYGLSNQYSQL
jgi:hypothetical protein